ncbi:hypothetical protein V9L05_18865 [Bernardetia sp. Wsw4-3y2]|uniref:hypothetical protein n=1 Tax=Bernardetia sp. Wsw4-3y2 TaxID=3127471 RepID=UPI0030CD2A85
MYLSHLTQKELELTIKSLNNTVNELREINNKFAILNPNHNEDRRAGKNQILNTLREYEDLLVKLEKEIK